MNLNYWCVGVKYRKVDLLNPIVDGLMFLKKIICLFNFDSSEKFKLSLYIFVNCKELEILIFLNKT